ncbi:MAG: CBS domain-containing protein [Pseudomonadota bacterium]
MQTLKQLIASRTQDLAVASPQTPVFDALKIMAERDVGALLVLDQGKLVGIFSERDYARKIILYGKASKDTLVGEIMSDKVLYVTPERSIDECLALMSEKKFRHLPVLDHEQQVIALVSIGDLVTATISEQQFIIQQLERYINS